MNLLIPEGHYREFCTITKLVEGFMKFILHVICNLLQVAIGLAVAVWVITLMALFGQGIIDVSNHIFQCGVMFVVALILSPFLFKVFGKMWDRLADFKRQTV